MKRVMHGGVVSLVFVVFCLASMPAVSDSSIDQLATSKRWLALLHMRKDGSGFRSEVDAPDFFLSGSRTDPLAELHETVGFFQRDSQAWCRFPARGAWLQAEGLALQPVIDCAALQQWRSAFPVGKLVLVFPSVYLNSASSMFGHTFLRFEDPGGEGVSRLGKAVSYYADMNQEHGSLEYIYKGLAGGFKGVVDVSPFYEMSRKYVENEDRDMWEYTLTYSGHQIGFLIDHLWEIRGHSFDYYFLDENCSYRIIDILDVVTPPYDMRENFHVYALPVETIRLLDAKGLVGGKVFRPSATKLLKYDIARFDAAGQQQVKMLLQEKEGDMKAASDEEIALALRYLQAGIHKHGVVDGDDEQVKRFTGELLARAGSDRDGHMLSQVAEEAIPYRVTETSPDLGHLNRRLRFMSGQADGVSFNEYEWRETFHDYSDPLSGYEPGIQLDGPGVVMRQFHDHWELERVNFIDIESLNEVDGWFKPLSWDVSVVRQRDLVDHDRPLVNSADVKLGFATNVFGWRFFMLGGGGLAYSSHLDQGLAWKDAVTAGALYQDDQWSFLLDVDWHDYPLSGVSDVRTARLVAGRKINRNLSWQLRFQEDVTDHDAYRSLSTGIAWYY